MDFCRGYLFISLMCWMVMGFLSLPINTVLVVDNTVMAVLGFSAELFLKTEVALLR